MFRDELDDKFIIKYESKTSFKFHRSMSSTRIFNYDTFELVARIILPNV